MKKKIILILSLIMIIGLFVGCRNKTIDEPEIEDPTIETKKNNYTNNSGDLWNINDIPCDDKPIIYLYPEKEMKITVKLGNPEKLICTYPKYEDSWTVIAKPDGKLVDTKTGRSLYALYWEGKDVPRCPLNEGFVVKGEDSIPFLEEKLKVLGLNDYETEEFIIYWLPQLEANEYNFIRFTTKEEIDNYMPLEVSGNPDSVIRVLMQFKGLDKPIEVKEQKLTTPDRTGFTVVEWGGSEMK